MKLLLLAVLLSVSCASDIKLVTFDGAKETTHTWKEKNDPVMGGQSTGTTTVSGGTLIFDGTVAIVPSLKAPGFITSMTDDGMFHSVAFPDASSCEGVSFTVKSTVPYKGYRFSFGNKHASGGKFFAYGFKSRFDAPLNEFGTVQIPFKDFTDFWDDATGNPIKTCKESPENCPDKATLENMKTVTFWGEGVEGKLHLEVKEISAYGCSAGKAAVREPVKLPTSNGASSTSDIKLVTFDGSTGTTHTWKEMNDPVMGGKSTGTTAISGGALIFDGNVAIVPSLKAPGFITSTTSDHGWFNSVPFPDVSSCEGVSFTVKSTVPYKGYRFCFGDKHASGGKFFAYGFKSRFDAPLNEFGTVKIPFKDFTDFWDDATGNPIKTCSESPENCPDKKTLENMKVVSFWGEGVEGKVHLEVKEISAYGCSAEKAAAEDPVKLVIV